ncbi:1-aminocyclopropane-1-carboxylate deaminase [Pseudomonas citronellolis]|uniref:1-aminocyclopropane-1-carboxylate deaminase n=1 Tax=Pseudomonas citronellolis TaxID=53408 RepID=A0AAQ1KLH2_9PSED|nr:pyridoxal-phosphate dependent enzyme [Pseudomonas citronellolis]MCP1642665.1 1-aminocyclopropane-1-carboxylate deaminase [Pseudomonas citronellolis]MCP1696499.1 1-aminocyclopropane-1-carboxylate deaminase [Pseudomonas citronellolis]MCP1703145.1 1-aminocyclopropane-1-carboxylate deaminase [Pseudomonas citronellolis]TGC32895.1 1-aminocyclopropane-1-carboxylate deaminase [Pseudomonas citronellolis]SFD74174.1 1-aminocyclopropane-1-carboxylate deaminase [Pseudomonas citronellolis]
MQQLRLDWLEQAGVELALLRLDLVDERVSGNKWFKLAPYLRQAAEQGLEGLISLGGAHSNHLHALAAAGQRFGFATVGLLRGNEQDTPTVRDLRAWGMQLHWLGYAGYRERHAEGFWAPWRERYPRLLAVDEGGGGLHGALGCAPLVEQLGVQLLGIGWNGYDQLWAACGTGTTLAGLVLGEQGAHPLIGALAVPPGHGVEAMLPRLLAEAGREDAGYRLLDASRGGFGKVDAELVRFMADFEAATGVPLEPLYTGKLLLVLHDEVSARRVPRGSRLVAVHSGGLQGRRAMEERLGRLP